jgi:hypothetical protein
MGSPTKRWLVATITVALAAVAGCSAVTGGPAPSATSGGAESADGGDSVDVDSAGSSVGGACGSEPGFCVTVDITGAATVQGTAQTLNLGTCADFAKGESPGGSLQLPGLLGEEIGGRKVSAVNEIREYAGPGTYDKDMLKSVAGVIDVSIDTTPYQPADDTTAQAVINADGSGSFTFANLKEGEQGNPTKPKGTISGSFTWTCTD